jgi:deoxyribodipyrimidine photo-lyase
MQPERSRQLNQRQAGPGPVLFWMGRDQRLRDNWALLKAQEIALKVRQPLNIVICLDPDFPQAHERQWDFLLKGLAELEKGARKLNINFQILAGSPERKLPEYIKKNNIGTVVTDFSPLRLGRQWRDNLAKRLKVSLIEVDAHNIVPAWISSNKQEYAAYTFRPKINRLLGRYLDNFPKLKKHPYRQVEKPVDWDKVRQGLKVDRSVKPVSWLKPGETAARTKLEEFLKDKFTKYNELRNDPTVDYQSNLSPYLHFGQISAQRVALDVQKASHGKVKSEEAFLEELIVRRELADNFCLYNPDYDSVKAFPNWSQKTLAEHKNDPREYIYSQKKLEQAATHDELWNAAQREMVGRGKMHGYLRMYWAKKILEWTRSPEEAMETAVYLNDKYELDGRDPNGYAGVAWSIGGVHDRAWPERPVFGKVRYMNYRGARRKFKVDAYVKKFQITNISKIPNTIIQNHINV